MKKRKHETGIFFSFKTVLLVLQIRLAAFFNNQSIWQQILYFNLTFKPSVAITVAVTYYVFMFILLTSSLFFIIISVIE